MQAIRHIGLPEVFTPETTDVYDRKNMPRVVFCLHALSLFLYKAREVHIGYMAIGFKAKSVIWPIFASPVSGLICTLYCITS